MTDDSDHSTYVAERNLEPDSARQPIVHPMLERFFSGFEQGRYRRHRRDH